MKSRLLNALLILVMALTFAVPTSAAPTVKSDRGSYIVLMAGDPVASYEGEIAGLPATRPGRGGKLNPNGAPARQYAQYLRDRHTEALRAAGAPESARVHDYSFALNGFSVILTAAEAGELAKQPGVLRVIPDQLRYKTTDSSPGFLGLTDHAGAYIRGLTGEGVVVGVIDTGIWPEHPSFADDGSYGPAPITIEDLDGRPACDFGNTAQNPNDAPFDCNNKLIGARLFLDTYRELTGLAPDEYGSARDDDGHGSHTASTAAGNAGVQAQTQGIPRGAISGIAPRARIVAYKALGNQGGYTSDLAGAIDQAVADGVDVINYSIGGGASLAGGDDLAFLFAADAGVFVATSGGNSGPGAATIGGPGSVPWVTTVGASTQMRVFEGTVILGSGATYTGASVTAGVGPAPLVDAADLGNELCDPAVPFTGSVTGKIVLCKRGVVDRVAKSRAVAVAGGVGMILWNADDVGDLATDPHMIPSVHTDATPGLAIRAYIDTTANPTAQLTAGQPGVWPNAPTMAAFSSRGPDPVAQDIIKPDVTAPGVQILAGNSPTPDPGTLQGELFQVIQGTSMSSPHVAGVFALLKQAHPDWTPAMAKSALMTTAYQDVKDNDRVSPANPFAMGAGHINPGGKVNNGSLFLPGLVYDAGFNEYLGFLCDAEPGVFGNPAATCAALANAGIPTEARNLNLASIGIASVPGSETVIRTVTNVAGSTRRYDASIEAPPGFQVTVTPSNLILKDGQSATFTVQVQNVSAPIGEWRFGSLTWRDRTGTFTARSPIAVRGTQFSAPAEVSASGASGALSFDVKFGYTGAYTAAAHGLAEAVLTPGNVLQDPNQTFDPTDVAAGGADVIDIPVTSAAHLRVKIPPEAAEAEADLDLFLYNPSGQQVASSTQGGTDEQIDISLPADGTWKLYIHGWAAPGGDSNYTLSSWVVPMAASSLSLDTGPASATIGAVETIGVSWSGLNAGSQYLGAVSHSDAVGIMGFTLIEVATP